MATIRRLIGVYSVDGTVRADVAYAVGKVLGRRHCPLCDITHGWSPVERRASRARRMSFPVPFDLVHQDERTAGLADVTDRKTPCVLAETDDGFVELVDARTLAMLDGDPTRLVAAIEHGVARVGLSWAQADGERAPGSPPSGASAAFVSSGRAAASDG